MILIILLLKGVASKLSVMHVPLFYDRDGYMAPATQMQYIMEGCGGLSRMSGKPKVPLPSPPYLVPRRLNRAVFDSI